MNHNSHDHNDRKASTSNGMEVEHKNDEPFWKELVKLVVIALVVVVPFRLYVAQPFIVDGASMDPTFRSGEYLIVDEFTYHFRTPARGSVLIFKYPKQPSKYFIKRVIGLPGETVSLDNGQVTIFNESNPGGFILEEPYVQFYKQDTLSRTLKAGEYFVMGDNRLGSADSRLWGPVPEDNIIGRPLLRVMPPALLPGSMSESEIISNLNLSE